MVGVERCQCEGGGHVKITAESMRRMRRHAWEMKMNWDENDKDRIITSRQVNPEDLQNFEVAMVVVGYDVISLYPNMKIDQVCEIVRQAVLTAGIKWREIDYMEAARYIALNLTAEEVATSGLRRVLPWRRKKGGKRPGPKGAGPKGATSGDTEQ